MADYDLGSARGRIVIDEDTRGASSAAKSMSALALEARSLERAFRSAEGPMTKMEGNIGTLTSYLQIYSAKNGGEVPSNNSGLRALLIKRILTDESLLTDTWGEPVQYAAPARRSEGRFDVWSKGPDKISGTDDDIGNWIPR